METTDVKVVQSENAFTLDVQIYVSNGSPDRVQTVTLCNVLAFICRCPVCDKAFATAQTLKIHMKLHSEEEPTQAATEAVIEEDKAGDDTNYTCLASVQSGEQHFIFITQDGIEEVENRPSDITQIKKHKSPRVAKKTEMSRRPYQCTKCDLGFMTRTKLNIHTRTHTGEKPFACETCQKAFATRGELTVHLRVHTGDKPYTCIQCGTCHRTRSALHGHIHRYHQERAYKCDTCNKTFAIKSYYQAHLRIHDDKNPFRCSVCEKSFPYQSFLDKHMSSHKMSDPGPPVKKRKGRKRGRKGKKAKEESSKSDAETEAVSISTEEKEKIAVEVLQKGRAAGDASQEIFAKTIRSGDKSETPVEEVQPMETDTPAEETTSDTPAGNETDMVKVTQTSSAQVISSDSHSQETVLRIETMKNGAPETIYVTLANTDLQQVTDDGTQLTLVQESADSSQLQSALPDSQVNPQNIQLMNDTGMVVVTETPVGLEQVVMTENNQSDAQIATGEPQVAAILSQTEATTSDPTEYARRVDAVVQELEKRINTNE